MNRSRYIIGDSRKLLEIFEAYDLNKVDLVLTSPPYFNLLNYENSDHQIGIGQEYNEYLEIVANIIQQCYAISKRNANLWIIADTIRKNGITIPLPFDIINKLNNNYGAQTWKLRDVVIWDKHKNIPWFSKGRFKNQFEYILFFSKTNKYKFYVDRVRNIDNKKWWLTYPERYNPKGKPPANIWGNNDVDKVWKFTIPMRGWGNGYQKHLCPLPFSLIERILHLCSNKGDVIFDPFAGSGSVLALAAEMKRDSVGIDINEKYKDQFEKEVILGASKYWLKRKEEIEVEKKQQNHFAEVNYKLRVIKAGVKLTRVLVESYSIESMFVLLFNLEGEEGEKFILINNSPYKDIRLLEKLNNIVKEINKGFKIDIVIDCIRKNEFFNEYKDAGNLFSYSEKSRFKYIDEIPISKLVTQKEPSGFLYSNIRLNLDKSFRF